MDCKSVRPAGKCATAAATSYVLLGALLLGLLQGAPSSAEERNFENVMIFERK